MPNRKAPHQFTIRYNADGSPQTAEMVYLIYDEHNNCVGNERVDAMTEQGGVLFDAALAIYAEEVKRLRSTVTEHAASLDAETARADRAEAARAAALTRAEQAEAAALSAQSALDAARAQLAKSKGAKA